ncbi:DEAD/DEAH box helicase [Maridesulfovibrio salexigens]|uniref:DEAD-box ATP-dependent RNA helicase RhpA n=1 Tax=Maridesulfovibrio salexigens (strain ATCC 14822 / DSM 2638 / NCIMB 8403 / VKM B-1763) TaxID=526222 RepID=C6C1F3_MARSD|nr:DEAD/DEAH box helicase [Maridesulfovibrio salexigens]ACS81128.1 DEAD/DEAH box helicase domain protein [Maridesulfovibrio salexigens DSM 2638]
MSFKQFSFDRRIMAGIHACGYETPTPIQTKAIPEVLKGRDVMGLAQTGTGKTAAFALPIMQRLLEKKFSGQGPIRVLVLAPTRELALQIHENFMELGVEAGIRSAAVFGGVGAMPQIQAARRSSVIVACPGRLLDLMNQGVIKLDKVDTLVLDEADRMLDMGFLPDIRKIMSKLPQRRQNLLFSATMPDDIRDLADKILYRPATVQVANTAPAKTVEHVFYPVSQHLKNNLLFKVLEQTDYDSLLVFTRTKHKAKNLARRLAARGHKATFLQGNMSQNQRQRALDGFRDGSFKVMVATDIAARGIDCDRITHVVNLDVPDTAETYTHRIGRTGRAGRSGSAFSFVTRDDLRLMREIEKAVGYSIEHRTLEDFDYDKPNTHPAPAKRGGGRKPAADRKPAGERRPGRGRKPAEARDGDESRKPAGERKSGGRRKPGGGRKPSGGPAKSSDERRDSRPSSKRKSGGPKGNQEDSAKRKTGRPSRRKRRPSRFSKV